MASLPGDPQADLFVKLDKDDVAGLIDNGYFRIKLTQLHSSFDMYIILK